MGIHGADYPGNGLFKSFTAKWHNKPYGPILPSRPELSVVGKVVFITGGGTGVGLAHAIAFNQAGAKGVAIFGRRVDRLKSAAEEIAKHGNAAVVYESVDISKEDDLKAAFARALKNTGGSQVDVFVSNACALPELGRLTDYTIQSWRRTLELNAAGTFNAIHAILPLLHPKAKIIDMNSGMGHMRPVPSMWAYQTLKAINMRMFEFLHAENPDFFIVSLQPGVIDTEMNDQVDGFAGEDDVALPANFSLWLCSPEAAFLNGRYVWANWDVDELKARGEEIAQDPNILKLGLHGLNGF